MFNKLDKKCAYHNFALEQKNVKNVCCNFWVDILKISNKYRENLAGKQILDHGVDLEARCLIEVLVDLRIGCAQDLA